MCEGNEESLHILSGEFYVIPSYAYDANVPIGTNGYMGGQVPPVS